MYKSIPDNLTNTDLTTVIHYAVKMLNKYKSKENKDIKIDDLPVYPTNPTLVKICNNLLDEIGIENLKDNNEELDKHMQALFVVLKNRLDSEIDRMTSKGKELLAKFKLND